MKKFLGIRGLLMPAWGSIVSSMNMTKNQLQTGIAVVSGLALVAIFFFFGGSFPLGQQSAPAPTDTATTTGLIVQDEELGTGATAQAGDFITVQYVGKLQDGTIFDQSSAHTDVMPGCSKAGQFCFVLGQGNVIPGWDEGLQGMKVGGKRLLIVPSGLAYGAQGSGPIPPNATLVFEVQLLGVEQQSPATGPTVEPAVNLEGANAD